MSKSDDTAFEQSLLDRGLLGIILIDQHDIIVNGTHTVKKLKKKSWQCNVSCSNQGIQK